MAEYRGFTLTREPGNYKNGGTPWWVAFKNGKEYMRYSQKGTLISELDRRLGPVKKPATDRAQLHRALDAVMDARAKDELVMWGIPKGETEHYKEVLLLSNGTPEKVACVKELATRDGFHSFRTANVNLGKPPSFGRNVLGKDARAKGRDGDPYAALAAASIKKTGSDPYTKLAEEALRTKKAKDSWYVGNEQSGQRAAERSRRQIEIQNANHQDKKKRLAAKLLAAGFTPDEARQYAELASFNIDSKLPADVKKALGRDLRPV